MEIVTIDRQTVASTLRFTSSMIDILAARIPGTEGSRSAAQEIAHNMRGFCDRVSIEPFSMHPNSLFHLGRIVSVTYGIALVLLFMGGPFVYIALALDLLVAVYAVVHYFLYGNLFDCFFKKKTGCNAVGVLEPAGEVRRQIVVAGHHDSPYVFNFLTRLSSFAGIRFFLAMLFYGYLMALSIYAAYQSAYQNPLWRLNGTAFILTLIGLAFIVPLFFFISTKASPGAGDNLNGSSIAYHIGRYFTDQKEQGNPLRHTRLIVLSTDGEEAGQRGARAFVHQHREELLKIPTCLLNFDSIYQLQDLVILTKDRHGFLPLSNRLALECRQTALASGYDVRTVPIPFGSGTDAAAFAEAGIEAVSFIGLPTSLFAKERVYHTMKDTVDRIDPEAVEAVFNIAINEILFRDQAE